MQLSSPGSFSDNKIIMLYEKLCLFFVCKVVPYVVIVSLYIYPNFVTRLNHYFERRFGFILNENKIPKSLSLLDDFKCNVHGVKNLNKINIIMRGDSVSVYKDSIDYSLPTFYINVFNPLDICRHQGDVFHITGDTRVFDRLKKIYPDDEIIKVVSNKNERNNYYNANAKNKLTQLFFENPIMQVVHRSKLAATKDGVRGPLLGSGLVSIIALLKVSNKINIYGWDQYMSKSVKSMSNLQFLFSLMNKPKYCSCVLPLISEKILNLYYAAKLHEMKSIEINSYLNGMNDKDKLIDSIESLIYND
jgi:hypothetical protein